MQRSTRRADLQLRIDAASVITLDAGYRYALAGVVC